MRLVALRTALGTFESGVRGLMSLQRTEWLKTVDARWLDERDLQFKDRFGIYFYSSEAGDVLYIGKAQDSTLLQRVWSHLARPSLERKKSTDRKGLSLYPQHQWNALGGEYVVPARLVEAGEIAIDAA